MSIKKIVLVLVSSIAILGLAGFLYQAIGRYRDNVQFPAPGKLVDIGGYKLHITESGEGAPSVVMDAGTGSFSAMWGIVPEEVSKFTRVFCYDRAGLGWSDESPRPRLAENMVEELHALLEKSQVPKPYILVGHSLGGGTVQLYANSYPNEVYGLVLVDAAHEKAPHVMQDNHLTFQRTMTGFTVVDPSVQSSTPQSNNENWYQRVFSRILASHLGQEIAEYTGLKRWYLKKFYTTPGNAQYVVTPRILSRLLRPSTFRTTTSEIFHYGVGAQEISETENRFRNKPLIVISNGKGFFYNGLNHADLTPEEVAFDDKVWDPLQKDLATKSSRGKQVIAKNSGHRVQDTEPGLIVDAIQEIVSDYRKNVK